jgi:hypothetical protein
MAAAACSHNVPTEWPTSPTQVARPITLAKLTITPQGGGTMLAGTTVPIASSGTLSDGIQVGAFAQYSDGSGKYVEAAWASSDANVAMVKDGNLVAIARGTATLTATVQGMSAAETFVVDPGIPGLWVGNYVIDDCTAGSASVYDFVCGDTPGRTPGFLKKGVSAPIAMQITQNGKDLSAATQAGQFRGVLTGIDRGSNFLSLNGDLLVDQTKVTILIFDARVKQDVMEGLFGFEVRVNGLPSWAALTAHFDGMTRR